MTAFCEALRRSCGEEPIATTERDRSFGNETIGTKTKKNDSNNRKEHIEASRKKSAGKLLCLGCFPMGIPSSTPPELPGSSASSSPASMLQVVGSVSGWGRSQGTSYSLGNIKAAARQLPEEQRGIRTGC